MKPSEESLDVLSFLNIIEIIVFVIPKYHHVSEIIGLYTTVNHRKKFKNIFEIKFKHHQTTLKKVIL